MPRPFAARLLAWYDRHRRDLPWRRTADPWAIWVSEVMLQQTRVEAVRERFTDFLRRYPTPQAFARVGEAELLTAWRGLGYYRRARMLRDGAKAVVERHGGRVPREPEQLAALPGVGPYTTGAIASIAFGHQMAAVDGNVERVLARHGGIEDPVKSSRGRRSIGDAAKSHQDPARPGDFNHALMELGAVVCTPRSPSCGDCPVRADCAARRSGRAAELPVLPARKRSIDVHARVVLAPGPGGTVIGQRVAAGAVNHGQLDLPGPGPLVSLQGGAELEEALRRSFGLRVTLEAEACTVRHGITNHRIVLTAHWGSVRGRPRPPLRFADPNDPTVPWTTLSRKVFARVLTGGFRCVPGARP